MSEEIYRSTAEKTPLPAPEATTEDVALALLKAGDTPAPEIEKIAKDSALMKARKVRLAVAIHPRAPRRVALRLIREFHTFDLMHFSLTPTAPADLKRVADGLLVARLASITLGERMSLARRSSAVVATALLLDQDTRVWKAALGNPRVTEAAVVKALQSAKVAPGLVEAVSRHEKWSVRPEIQLALLRCPYTPLARALEFARGLSPARLRDILHTSKLPGKIKEYLRDELLAGE